MVERATEGNMEGLKRSEEEVAKTEMAAAIRQYQKLEAIGTLAGGVAHELNNPLQVIMTSAALSELKISAMEGRFPEVVELRGPLGDIRDAAKRCADIIHNLLAFSRKEQPEKSILDIIDLLRRTVELMEHSLSIHGVRIEKGPIQGPLFVRGNPTALQQVFTNLLLNARDAMPKGGIVVMDAQKKDGQIEITVKDHGTGIPPEQLPRLFEPFFTTKPVGRGTGLGLSVSYSTVQDHGGIIVVESEMGRGTTFRVRLPLMGEGRV